MISFFRACESHWEHGANWAVVCSRPPSEVGVGMISCVEVTAEGDESGRK